MLNEVNIFKIFRIFNEKSIFLSVNCAKGYEYFHGKTGKCYCPFELLLDLSRRLAMIKLWPATMACPQSSFDDVSAIHGSFILINHTVS